MLNPDGVIAGNYRTGFAGKQIKKKKKARFIIKGRDLNRQYKTKNKLLFPVIIGFRELLNSLKLSFNKQLFAYLDLHGHSAKQNVFAYGPQYPRSNYKYYESQFLPKLLSQHSEMFHFAQCLFKISRSKLTTSRVKILFSHNLLIRRLCFSNLESQTATLLKLPLALILVNRESLFLLMSKGTLFGIIYLVSKV